jgi:hypothetical protein
VYSAQLQQQQQAEGIEKQQQQQQQQQQPVLEQLADFTVSLACAMR